MKMMFFMLLAISVFMTMPAYAARFLHEPCDISRYNPPFAAMTPAQQNRTGCALVRDGWKEVARCDGREWTYLLEKEGKFMFCEGLDEHQGAAEKPCTTFSGGIDSFNSQLGRVNKRECKDYGK